MKGIKMKQMSFLCDTLRADKHNDGRKCSTGMKNSFTFCADKNKGKQGSKLRPIRSSMRVQLLTWRLKIFSWFFLYNFHF